MVNAKHGDNAKTGLKRTPTLSNLQFKERTTEYSLLNRIDKSGCNECI